MSSPSHVGGLEVVSSGHRFLESPRWHDGALYASDFYTREVLRWNDRGSPASVVRVPGQPSGLGWGPDGELLVVSMTDRRLLRYDEAVGLAEVADLHEYAPWHCNDMVVDSAGRAYVGNFGWDDETDPAIRTTVLLLADPGGTVTLAAEGLVNPNGMAITPDGGTLLVSETFAARVTAFERASDGTLGRRRVWAAFGDRTFATVPEALESRALLPDGIALDAEGALWVGDCVGREVARVAEGGRILDRVPTGDLAGFAVALGGRDGRTLYVCAAAPYGTLDHRSARTGVMGAARVAVPAPAEP